VPLSDSTLATCSDDGTIRVWNLDRFECLATLEGHAKITCCAGCNEGKVILAGTEEGTLRRWDVTTKTCVANITAHQGPLRSLSVNAGEDMVATTGGDGAIRLWRASDLGPCSTPHMLRPTLPYEAMNITGTTGLTSSQKEALMALGAIAIPGD